jgi:hypothetical protein
MVQQSEVTSGWLKTKNGARYANVSQRTFRDWFKEGLRHVRLPRIVGELAGELGG